MTRETTATERSSDDIQSFGRRRARKLSARQKSLLDKPFQSCRLLTDAGELTPAVLAACQDPARPVWLEIGFGGGEHLVWQARSNPGVTLIGCEPFIDGLVKVVTAIEEHAIGNIYLHDDDVRPVLRCLPAGSINRAFVLFPDPWPKRRHIKRRLVAKPLLDELAHVMPPGAELRVGTDIADYARTILLAVLAHGAFEWHATRSVDWTKRPSDWPKTRYEAKAEREHRRSSYFSFRRTANI